jgi:hypothetical protein
MKPYELGWICSIEPTNLPGDLQALIIGADAVSWYKQEIDKFTDKLAPLVESGKERVSAEEEKKRLEDNVWKAFEEEYLQA